MNVASCAVLMPFGNYFEFALYMYNYASVRMRKRGIHGSVFVCVCVVRLLQLNKVASKSFYRLLVMFSWICICGFAK